jgi:hypothetical protein
LRRCTESGPAWLPRPAGRASTTCCRHAALRPRTAVNVHDSIRPHVAEKKLTFTLEPRQERYVRLKIQMGLLVGRIIPELVDKTEAEEELKGLSFITNPLQ